MQKRTRHMLQVVQAQQAGLAPAHARVRINLSNII
jgi:hypothetical protein